MPDRLFINFLLVSFGLGVAYSAIPAALRRVSELARSPVAGHDGTEKTQKLQDDPTESLSTKTLLGLVQSHSYELHNAALRVVAFRASKGPIKDALIRDLASKNDETRDNAINGLWLLLYSPARADEKPCLKFIDLATFSALISALVNVLPQHNRDIPDIPTGKLEIPNNNIPHSPLCPRYRPAHEMSLMIMLRELLLYRGDRYDPRLPRNNVETALEAGLVTRWLANYPFPCGSSANAHMNYKRSDVSRLFDRKAWASDDPLMSAIFQPVRESALGFKQLREVGLRDRSFKRSQRNSWSSPWNHAWDDEENEEVIIDSDARGGDSFRQPWFEFQPTQQPRPRSTDRTLNEERMRRRHREAVVVANPGEPLTQNNILQRQNSAPDDITDEVYDGLNPVLGQEFSLRELRRRFYYILAMLHLLRFRPGNLLSLAEIGQLLLGRERLPYFRRAQIHNALKEYWNVMIADLGLEDSRDDDGNERSLEQIVLLFGRPVYASGDASEALLEILDADEHLTRPAGW